MKKIWTNSKFNQISDVNERQLIIDDYQMRNDGFSKDGEGSFLKYYKDAGISLYKSDRNLNKFEKLNYDNKPEPCN